MTQFTEVWPTEFCDQEVFIDDLLNFIESYDNATKSVFLYQPTEPTSGQLQAAWEAEVGAGIIVPPGARLFWFDSVRLVIDNLFETTYEAPGISSGTFYKTWDKRKTLDMTVISDTLLEDDASTSIAINPLDQTMSHLFAFILARTATAGAATPSLQTQTVGGVYGGHILNTLGTPVISSADTLFTNTSFFDAQSGPNSAAPAASYRWGLAVIPNYAQTLRDKMCIFQGGQFTGAAPFAANLRQALNFIGGRNTVGAVTTLTLINAGVALKQGSRLTVFGLR